MSDAPQGWQPIATAPENEIVLVYHPRFVNPVTLGINRTKPYQGGVGKCGWRISWHPADCWHYIAGEPLGWHPLPKSP